MKTIEELKNKIIRCNCSCHELKRLGWPDKGIKKHICCPQKIEIIKPENEN